MTVHYRLENKVAVVTFDNPPLNVFGRDMRAELLDAIQRAAQDRPSRLILTGAGRAFVAGADAREFDGKPLPPHLNDVLAQLTDLPFPTIAAINGTALGGGLEIALACRYRIAAPGATLGLPEVTLGIVPGAGGTQRLSRLIPMAAALDMIGRGRSVSAEKGLDMGLVDQIAADPVAAAHSVGKQVLHRALIPDQRPAPDLDTQAVDDAHAQADRRAAGQIAPHLAIDLVAAAASETLEQTMLRERRTFLDLRQSQQAHALRHVFFAERAALSQGKAFAAPKTELSRAVVVGGGNMGASIAYALATAGLEVTVVETDANAVNRAKDNIARLITQGAARAGLDPAVLQVRLSVQYGYEGLPPAGLAIEAAFEDMSVKRTIFAALQAALPRDAVLATNTSYLDVNTLALGIDTPERFLGLHFFAPAHIMKLLEIVRGEKTSDATLGVAFALARRLGKMPVLSGVCDGFIGNRILTRYRHAADTLLLQGATPDSIDAAMRAFGMAMGPYQAQDLSGLDIAYANRKRQAPGDRQDRRYVPIADRLVEDLKRLGRKTNAGWYDYDADGTPQPSQIVLDCIVATSAQAQIPREPIPPQVISARLLLAMIAEACDILTEGIAARPADIDLVLVHGYGFPRWRGGPMHQADRIGVPMLIDQLNALCENDPLSWSVPGLLTDLAAANRTLNSLNT